jgi:hypothetical protein
VRANVCALTKSRWLRAARWALSALSSSCCPAARSSAASTARAAFLDPWCVASFLDAVAGGSQPRPVPVRPDRRGEARQRIHVDGNAAQATIAGLDAGLILRSFARTLVGEISTGAPPTCNSRNAVPPPPAGAGSCSGPRPGRGCRRRTRPGRREAAVWPEGAKRQGISPGCARSRRFELDARVDALRSLPLTGIERRRRVRKGDGQSLPNRVPDLVRKLCRPLEPGVPRYVSRIEPRSVEIASQRPRAWPRRFRWSSVRTDAGRTGLSGRTAMPRAVMSRDGWACQISFPVRGSMNLNLIVARTWRACRSSRWT